MRIGRAKACVDTEIEDGNGFYGKAELGVAM